MLFLFLQLGLRDLISVYFCFLVVLMRYMVIIRATTKEYKGYAQYYNANTLH